MSKKYQTYRVTWEMDFEARSPREAAALARETHLDPDSWAVVFEVFDERDRQTRVDLMECVKNTTRRKRER